jgi:hypothetical protein
LYALAQSVHEIDQVRPRGFFRALDLLLFLRLPQKTPSRARIGKSVSALAHRRVQRDVRRALIAAEGRPSDERDIEARIPQTDHLPELAECDPSVLLKAGSVEPAAQA